MKIWSTIAAAFAISVGLIVLLGYFFPEMIVFVGLRQFLLQWAITLAAVALFIGLANLFTVHLNKTSQGGEQSLYSGVLVFSLAITFIIVLALGPGNAWSQWLFANIQVPIETSLMAVLAVSLAYASARLLRRRPSVFTIIFVVTVLIVLLGTGPLITSQIPEVDYLRDWIAQVPAAAGAREFF